MAELSHLAERYGALFIGAHLDDVVLSCGGQIADTTKQGGRVLIATVMAGEPPRGELSPFATELHGRWALAQDGVAVRRQEDVAACGVLGAEVWHGRVPDCIYRRDPITGETFYNSGADIFGGIAEAERVGLLGEITAVLRQLPPADQIYAPLGIGNHVDHQLVRLAAEQAFGWAELHYYEDYPYVQSTNLLATWQTAETVAGRQWQNKVIPLTAEGLAARGTAILAYRSQISTFFADEADLRAQLAGYCTAVGGERIWQRTA
jgi:LmbE family N-acetylglucosaminyl deacetylase